MSQDMQSGLTAEDVNLVLAGMSNTIDLILKTCNLNVPMIFALEKLGESISDAADILFEEMERK